MEGDDERKPRQITSVVMAHGAVRKPEEKEITVVSQICKSTLWRDCSSTWPLFQTPPLL
jgi:hypothetical protein